MSASGPDDAVVPTVVLLTKPAVAGRVKTRMTSRYSAEQAASLHQCLLEDVASQLASGAERSGYAVDVAWALEPIQGEQQVASRLVGELPSHRLLRLPPGVRGAFPQVGEDLGQRIFHALRTAVSRGAPKVIAVGSDHPELDSIVIDRALHALQASEAAIAPSHDGGYGLLALRSEILDMDLFRNIDWSTERVFEQTIRALKAKELRMTVLPSLHDVDLPSDLDDLASRLGWGEERPESVNLAPRTREWFLSQR